MVALRSVSGVLRVLKHSFLKDMIHKVAAISATTRGPKAGVSKAKGRVEEEKRKVGALDRQDHRWDLSCSPGR